MLPACGIATIVCCVLVYERTIVVECLCEMRDPECATLVTNTCALSVLSKLR